MIEKPQPNTSLGDDLSALIYSLQELFDQAELASPLVLDLDNDGVETLPTSAGTYFDHDGNGFAELTGWVGADDGLLVLDRNGNGAIDDGRELFGNHSRLASGALAENGFTALGELDANGDGRIDADDAAFSQLRVWQDADSDAMVDVGEWLSFAEVGVQSLGLAYTAQDVTDAQGNQHRQMGQYIRSDGGVSALTDVWFAADQARSLELNRVAVDEAIAALPDLQGFGNVRSLHQAMARDESGTLRSLVTQFINEPSYGARSSIMATLMHAWAGVDDVAPDSQPYINDARKMAALEVFLGEYFRGSPTSNLWGYEGASILTHAYNELLNHYSAQLMAQSHFKFLYDGFSLEWNSASSTYDLDITQVLAMLQQRYEANAIAGTILMHEFGADLMAMGEFGSKALELFRQRGDGAGDGFEFQLSKMGWLRATGADVADQLLGDSGHCNGLFGLAGDDFIQGMDFDDYLNGGAGNDELSGFNGQDILAGEAGDDTLSGESGNDTYVFRKGDGQDVINNYDTTAGRVDTICFEDVASEELIAVRFSADDLIIEYGADDKLTLIRQFGYGDAYAMQRIEFGDGTVWTIDRLLQDYGIDATAGNDYIFLGSFTAHVRAGGGADTVTGGNGDDVLDGGADNDALSGGSGNDTLDGGAGTDTLSGGNDDDLYIVENASDIVVEDFDQGNDGVQSTLSWTLGANLENLTLAGVSNIDATGNELTNTLVGNAGANILDGKGGADSMTGGDGNDSYNVDHVGDVIVENANEGIDTVISTLTHALGAALENLTLTGSSVVNGTGNESANVIKGNGAANALYGDAGNDTLQGAGGHDVLDGGAGADVMYGGFGDDTYFVDDANDVVHEYFWQGQDTVKSVMSHTLGSDVEKLSLLGIAAINATGNGLANTLSGNVADNVLDGAGGADTMAGGLGNDTYGVDNAADSIVEYVGEGTDTVNSGIAWALGNNLENLTLTGTAAVNGTGNAVNNGLIGNSAANTLTGNVGNDRLEGMGGSDILDGGVGNDTYVLGLGYGSDTVRDNDATAGNTDVAVFLSGIAAEQIWFQHVGNHLEVSVIGTTDKLTFENWYTGSAYRVEQFQTSDDRQLVGNQVETLVQAMATFTPLALGQTTLPHEYQTALAEVIGVSWVMA
jgi:Ca2+-binding RTX toxin-like protein